jgi:3-oxoacyl-[acyl-carrier protein] reductase
MKLLEGKNVLITGGSRGIGKSIVQLLFDNGANVGFTFSSSESAANEIANNLNCSSQKCIAYKSDASKLDQCDKLIESYLNDFETIDVLINNAGITKDNLLMRMQEDDFDTVIKVNLKSVFNMTKAVQRTMLKQRYGSIINMSSVVGVKGNAGQTNYAASKAGIIGFSKSVALELGSRNIRCNVIAPGFIETEMTEKLDENVVNEWRKGIPLKRGGTPLDIANACLWLASDMSSYVTGQVINIDGGMLT